MLEDILDRLREIFKERFAPIALVYIILFVVILVRVFDLQILRNDGLTSTEQEKKTKIQELSSTRGNILDRNGVVLASNKLSYSVTIEDTGEIKPNKEKNKVIDKLIKLLEKKGAKLASDFYIKLDKNGNLYFDNQKDSSDSKELTFKRDAYSVKSIDELTVEQKESTAEDVFNFLRIGKGSNSTSMFDIDDKYSTEEALKIMQIRFQLMLNKYRKFDPITVATNVNQEAVAAIKEYSSELPGVEVVTGSYREYAEPKTFSHILGYTGLINNTELKEYNKEKDDSGKESESESEDSGDISEYSATDQVGKMGIEKTMESFLHGKKGSKTMILNENSEVEKISNVVEPVAGNDVYLTIDAELQNATYKLLEKEIAAELIEHITYGKETPAYSDVSKKKIPIYDVYYALLENNLVDIEHFQEDDAKECETRIYNKYMDTRKKSLEHVIDALKKGSAKPGKDLDDSTKDYLDRVYHILVEKGVLLKSNISKDDQTYQDYCDEKVSLYDFLQYAISKDNWIDLEKITKESNIKDDEKYLSVDEIYQAMLKYIKKYAIDDKRFNKFIYKELVYNDGISPCDICGALIEQGTLKDDGSYDSLKSHNKDAFNFVESKIKSCEIPPGQLGLDPCSGSIVITDYESGEVLAMVSYPSYDNNKMANVIDPKYYSSLIDSTSYSFVNRATQTKSAPGSTFKVLMSTAGLEEGVISPSETIYDEVAFKKISGQAPKCHSMKGHGSITVDRALRDSCNYFFYEVGWRLGGGDGKYESDKSLSVIRKYCDMYGLTQKSGVEIEEANPHVSEDDAIRTSIGQASNAYTPSQLSRYVTTVANKGTCYPLTLIKQAKDVKGNVVLDTAKKRSDDVKNGVIKKMSVKDSTWDAIYSGMRQVVQGQSAMSGCSLEVYGKTGTAQENKKRPDHGLFISYSKPKDKLAGITVTSVINFGYGSQYAVRLARKVYDYYSDPKNGDSLLNEKIEKKPLDNNPD